MKKILLYIRLNIFYMFRNKVRFILTEIGIILGLSVYIMGNGAVDSYINSLYNEVYDFDDASFIVYDKEDKIIESIDNNNEDMYIVESIICDDFYSVDRDYYYKKIEINNSVRLVGINERLLKTAIPYFGKEHISLTRTEILYGKDFTEENIKNGDNCIIIEESTALFLFQKDNAVGEYIDIITPQGYGRFEIIGIISDSPSRKYANLEFNRLISNRGEKKYCNNCVAYIPYGCLTNMMDNSYLQKRYIVNTDIEQQELMNRLINKITTFSIEAGITSRQTLLCEVIELEDTMKGFINAIIIVLIIISGFMIVTIYVFSVKERMYEIGVRRAVGASEADIIYQFIIEGVITAVIAAVVTLMISIFACNFVTYFLVGKLYMNIRFVLSGKLILSMFGLSVVQGIIFSYVPALIGSKIRLTEAIKWD